MGIYLCFSVGREVDVFTQWSQSDVISTKSLFVASFLSTPVFSLAGVVNNATVGVVINAAVHVVNNAAVGVVLEERFDYNSGLCVVSDRP